MSILYFCECCARELGPDDHKRIAGEEVVSGTRIQFEVMRGLGGQAMNSGQFCWECQAIAIQQFVARKMHSIARKNQSRQYTRVKAKP